MKQIRFVVLIVVIALFLTSCSGSLLTGSSWPGIASDGERIYLANSTTVVSLNQESGSKVWSYPEKPENKTMFYAAPAILNGEIVVGDYTRSLYSLDKNTGNQNWAFHEADGRYVASAVVLEDYILAPSSDHSLYVLDHNGAFQWKYETGQMIWAQPVSDGENVYIASMDHYLTALGLDTGNKLWDIDLGSAVIFSLELNEDGIIYVGTIGKKIAAVNSSNGKVIWQYETRDAVWARPLYLDGNIYIGDISGTVYSIDAEKGSVNWTNNIQGAVMAQAAIVEDNLVFLTEDGVVVALNLDGGQVWQKTFEGNLYSSPIVLEDKLIIGLTDSDDVIAAIDFNGNPIWTYSVK